MRKKIKILAGCLGIGVVAAASVAAVVSCSGTEIKIDKNNNTGDTTGSGTSGGGSTSGNTATANYANPYGMSNSVYNNTTWTYKSAMDFWTGYVTKNFGSDLTNNMIITAANDFAAATNNWMQTSYYANYRHYPTTFTYNGTTYTLKWTEGYKLENIAINGNYWNAEFSSTASVAVYDGSTLISDNILNSVQTLDYTKMLITEALTQTPIYNNDSYTMSSDYYAGFIANQFNLVFNATVKPASTQTPLTQAIISYLTDHGYILNKSGETFQKTSTSDDAPKGATLAFPYMTNGGFNFGKLNA